MRKWMRMERMREKWDVCHKATVACVMKRENAEVNKDV